MKEKPCWTDIAGPPVGREPALPVSPGKESIAQWRSIASALNQRFLLTHGDRSFNMKMPAPLSSINYRHQIGIQYFLRRNPQMPWISSQLSFNRPATAFWLAAFSHSMASAPNSAVKRLDGSAQGSRMTFTPCSRHSLRGGSACRMV